MSGERGGTTPTLDQAQRFILAHKGNLAAQIRADILDWLETHDEWHANDLRVPVPADSRNVMPAVVAGLVGGKVIEKTGERRKATAKASHGRDSNVFRLTAGGMGSEREVHPAASSESKSSVSPLPAASKSGPVTPDASSDGLTVVASQQEPEPVGGDTTSPADPLPLFELDEKRWKDAA